MRKFLASATALAMAATASVAMPAPAYANGGSGSAEACKFIASVFDELGMGDCMRSLRNGTDSGAGGGSGGGSGKGSAKETVAECKSLEQDGSLEDNLGDCVSDDRKSG